MDRNLKWHWIYWASAIFLVLLLQDVWEGVAHTEAVPYSEFEQALAEGRIKNVIVQDRTVTGELKTPQGRKTALMAVRVEPELAEHLGKYKVTYSRVVQSTLLSGLLSWLLPSLLVLGIWYFVIRKMADTRGPGGFLTIGKSRAKVYVVHDTGVTFADVAGVDEAKDELKEVVEFLKHPADFGRLGAHIPRGVLLVGPPGTGKTLLAKAVAGEAGTAFFSISGSEFVELFVGVGAARVRDLFEQARQKAPAIIFIDELDALGRARGAYPELGGHDEKEQTLNQLLAEMDGFDTSPGIVILAATNRPEILDPALLRAGRFDRQVMVDRPDRKGRVDILKVHIRKVKTDPALSLDEVAGFTAGFSGADLASLVNEAAIAATRRKADAVGADDFTVAFERIVAGLEKRNRVLDPAERERAAYHEMGHALVALSRPGDPVHKVSIIPRGGGALGYTIQRPTEDRYLMRRDELEHKVAVLLGGRAAEKLVFGEVSTGAADDLAKATQIAHEMVTRFGMDEDLGCASYESSRSAVRDVTAGSIALRYDVSEATRQAIDKAVRDILQESLERGIAILAANRAILDRSAQALLQQETLDEAALKELTVGLRPLEA
ncbi:ATP-dependent zinc metalloprotease FtsH [Lacisediminimonas profundi]|uniref:ATP-dependent zinc metalloprotease FtsH n=1 Tax=Lacisediminimonas profundi TaxID=2603856 RepID=UPI00124BA918|nr:ATP-dependent zinc metalloprotease FtsH [Lacisediminimonas profundi]